MRNRRRLPAALALAAPLAVWMARAAATAGGPASLAELRAAFEHPPAGSRIMMRWWWFGAAVEKPELERELRAMQQGGIGGVEIQPVYPLTLDDPAHGLRNLPYLSAGFLDAVTFANETARALGLRVDLTLTSGWPYGGPHTTADEASARLRVERVAVTAGAESMPLPAIGEGEKLIAAFLGSRRLEERDGTVLLPKDASGTVLFFVAGRTHQAVKRPAVGADGPVLDHYSRTAVEDHLRSVGEPLLAAFGNHPPYAVFSDSLEVYGADWTPDFLSEFQKRRGYDLTPYLPALADASQPNSAAIRHDWGKTLTELAEDHYLKPIRAWAASHHTLFRSQTYGTPPLRLSSNALVDLPEGEGSPWRSFTATRWASSASHLYGRPVTSSETWTWLDSPVFRASPLDMKAEADRHFLQGVNQLVGHGWPYSPPQAGDPGWHFYAAAVFNDHNPWWIAMPDIALYLQRISFLLRQGNPVNDVAIYLPTDDAWAGFAPGRVSLNEEFQCAPRAATCLLGANVITQVLDAGYNFDFIDDGAISSVGIHYPVLILPSVDRIPLASYRKIADYARHGGVVIAMGHTPSLAPGLLEADGPAIRDLSHALFGSPGAPGRLLKDESALSEALHTAIAPDVVTAPEIGVVHRKLPFAEVYFLVNTSSLPVHHEAVFRVKGLQGAWWDPFTSKVSPAGGARLELDLAPYESRVLVFSKELAAPVPASSGPASTPIDCSTGWKVTFAGESAPRAMDALVSWTVIPGLKNFSGVATYEKTVTVDAAWLGSHGAWLDFGEGTPAASGPRRSGSGMRALLDGPVREAAQVYVNGKLAGAVWHPPYRVDVSGLLRAGPNDLRIVVANLALNKLAGQPRRDERPLVREYGNRFQDQDMDGLEPLPAGLLGPVWLLGQ